MEIAEALTSTLNLTEQAPRLLGFAFTLTMFFVMVCELIRTFAYFTRRYQRTRILNMEYVSILRDPGYSVLAPDFMYENELPASSRTRMVSSDSPTLIWGACMTSAQPDLPLSLSNLTKVA